MIKGTIIKKFIALFLGTFCLGVIFFTLLVIFLFANLPDIFTLRDYQPALVSEVFDRKEEKIGEFFKENRILVPYSDIPKPLIQAFVAAEDSSFFQHKGINFSSIARAFIANLRARRKVQGGSTITMQVARSLLLSREKTYVRKLKEMMLSYRMEKNLSKEDILFLYLNQIYLGSGAYGVATASKIYFRKPLRELRVSEVALLAGLPQAPSRYSPIYNPVQAKKRQLYVIQRMLEEGYLSYEAAREASEEPVRIYVRQDFQKLAPFFLEVIRQMLVSLVGEKVLLTQGVRIYTGLDLKKQLKAREELRRGLSNLDKRQGFRGPLDHLETEEDIRSFLESTQKELIHQANPSRLLQADGMLSHENTSVLEALFSKDKVLSRNKSLFISPDLKSIKGVVKQVNDKWGFVEVLFGEYKGLIDLESMKWARKPDPYIKSEDAFIKKVSEVLKTGDVIWVKVMGQKFYSSRISKILLDRAKGTKKKTDWPADLPRFEDYLLLELEQEPLVEGSLLALDQVSSEVISMVGGYDFERSKFNRSLQATRQTGSAFKPILYLSALDKGFTPVTPILDAPVVYKEEKVEMLKDSDSEKEDKPSHRKWRPKNYSNRFSGDILFRNALIRSKNIPTVKITKELGVPWVTSYARRLGVFSPLNSDVTSGLGSSSLTLYEMTKMFSHIGRLGQKIKPLLIHKVEDKEQNILLENVSLDNYFDPKIQEIEFQLESQRKRYFDTLRDQSEEIQMASSSSENVEAEDVTSEQRDKTLVLNQKEKVLEAQKKEESLLLKDPFLFLSSRFFFEDSRQLISPSTTYVLLSLLRGVVEERGGTGYLARNLKRPVAGKTGTTDGNYDAWFLGFTPQVVSGVWVGFDQEKTLGRGEAGGTVALPIWLGYMKAAHEGLPVQEFPVPKGIVFANIDNKTGKLASTSSTDVVRQAFIEGTEPQHLPSSSEESLEEDKDFLRRDFSN